MVGFLKGFLAPIAVIPKALLATPLNGINELSLLKYPFPPDPILILHVAPAGIIRSLEYTKPPAFPPLPASLLPALPPPTTKISHFVSWSNLIVFLGFSHFTKTIPLPPSPPFNIPPPPPDPLPSAPFLFLEERAYDTLLLLVFDKAPLEYNPSALPPPPKAPFPPEVVVDEDAPAPPAPKYLGILKNVVEYPKTPFDTDVLVEGAVDWVVDDAPAAPILTPPDIK